MTDTAPECEPDVVSFDKDIKPFFQQYAGQMRWRFDLTSYDDVKTNAPMINQLISATDPDIRMPPPPFDPLADAVIADFWRWMKQGFPP